MQNCSKVKDLIRFGLLRKSLLWGLFILLLFSSFTPPPPPARCIPHATPFYGYSFFDADFVDASAAYAPFFLRFGDYYERNYDPGLIQKKENCAEWSERFCSKASWEEVAQVIYESDEYELARLHEAAGDPKRKTPLPFRLEDNDFAYVVAYNGCVEVTRYLTFAKRCEEHVVSKGDKWNPAQRNVTAMLELIQEGKQRFLIHNRILFGSDMRINWSAWHTTRVPGR